MEQTIDIQAYLRAYLRRWWLILLPVVVIVPIAAAVAWSLPPVYRATATIVVESQQIPSDLAQSTVTSRVEERIALIRQRLTARPTLLDIADRLEVFRGRTDLSPSAMIEEMRAATSIRGVTLGRRRGPVTSIEIGYSASDPRVAARVANEFVTLLVEQNVRQRNEQAVGTVGFFDREVDRLSRELTAAENELARFKSENNGALPESLASRRAELLSLNERRYEREIQRAALAQRIAALEEARASGGVGLDVAGVESPEEAELRRLNAALVEARSVYAETHPRVRLLVSRIAVLQSAMTTSAADPVQAAAGVDPVQRIEDAIAETEAAIAQLDDRDRRDVERIEALEVSIAATPDVVLLLNALTRRYNALQIQQADAIAKRAQAEIGERLEVNQQAERLEVVEQAQPPAAPESPNRRMIVAAAGAVAVGLGFGIVTLLEILNRTIRSAAELERTANLRAFATIPYISTRGEERRRAWAWRAAAAAAIVLVPAAGYMVDRYIAPLPVLFERALDRVGYDGTAAGVARG